MRRLLLLLFLSLGLVTVPALAQGDPNECDNPGEEPDVIVGSLSDVLRHGRIGDITAFSIGATSCNVGSCWLNWISGTPEHPVIGMNLFRLKDGRLEHIGQSWLKHGFATLDGALCSNSCIPADGQHLGVNCSDPYGAGLNGSQGLLGPKFEVDAAQGSHLHPFTTQGQGGDSIYKRLQVHNDDLNPVLNSGALYYGEVQYVTLDDAVAGNNANNISYRRILVSGTDPTFNISLTGPTFQQQIALQAWTANDTGVDLKDIPGGFAAAAKVTDVGGGMWHYEYAVQNVISHQSARSFEVALPHGALVTNVGFHDVDYHSGSPYALTDWAVTLKTGTGPNSIVWSTQSFVENENANALRWGTVYNFRFDADVAPGTDVLSLGMFRPGNPAARTWTSLAPERCGDGFCEAPETFGSCAADCESGSPGAGRVPDGEEVPGLQLLVEQDEDGELMLNWGGSCLATDSDYAIYSGKLGTYYSHRPVVCSTGGATIGFITPPSHATYYLIVPSDGIVEGSYGAASGASPRPASAVTCLPQQVSSCQ